MTLSDWIKTIDEKFRDKKIRYDLNRKMPRIFVWWFGEIDKY